MKDKKSFVMYKNWEPFFNSFTDEQAGKLIKAVYRYQCAGEQTELSDPAVSAPLSFFLSSFDSDEEKYESLCAQNKRNSKKRFKKDEESDGAPTDNDRHPSTSNDNERYPSTSSDNDRYRPTSTDILNDNDNDNDNVNDKDNDNVNACGAAAGARKARAAQSTDEFLSVLELYNSVCTSLPNCKSLTPERKNRLRALKKQLGSMSLEEFFGKVEGSDFLTGRSGRISFVCDFDWITAHNNAAKIIEGRFDRDRDFRPSADRSPPRKTSYDIRELEKINTLDEYDDEVIFPLRENSYDINEPNFDEFSTVSERNVTFPIRRTSYDLSELEQINTLDDY